MRPEFWFTDLGLRSENINFWKLEKSIFEGFWLNLFAYQQYVPITLCPWSGWHLYGPEWAGFNSVEHWWRHIKWIIMSRVDIIDIVYLFEQVHNRRVSEQDVPTGFLVSFG